MSSQLARCPGCGVSPRSRQYGLCRACRGDGLPVRPPLTPGQQALAADPRAVEYALNIARKYARRTDPALADEFEGAALVGLVKAAASFDPSVGTDFVKNWLPPRVIGAVLDAHREWMPKGFRRNGRTAPRTVRPALAHERDGGEAASDGAFALSDLEAGELPVGWEAEAVDEVLGMAAALPPRYAEAVRLYYTRAGARLKDVAAALGVSEARVSQMLVQAADMLREGRAA